MSTIEEAGVGEREIKLEKESEEGIKERADPLLFVYPDSVTLPERGC